jgi:hypothetical protein
VPGSYTIYAYVPDTEHAATTLHYTINNAKDIDYTHTHTRRRTNQRRVGYSRHLHFPKGNKTTVTLTSKAADGVVVADAMLFVPEK